MHNWSIYEVGVGGGISLFLYRGGLSTSIDRDSIVWYKIKLFYCIQWL